MRNALIQWLIDKAKSDDRIYLLTADLGYSVLEPFQQCFEKRFINVGVAEQNMVGIASGLATEELLPYTYSIGIFPTFRCAEQIRNDIDYHKLPVVSCTVGSGVAYGNLGYSHHAIQDISLMRSLKNMVIATPSCPTDVTRILDWHYVNPCPLYLRLHKSGEPTVPYEKTKLSLGLLMKVLLNPGKSMPVRARPGTCIISTGFLTSHVKSVVEDCFVDIPVFALPLWGQPALKIVIKQLKEYSSIIAVEDHIIEGGFASYLMEALAMSNSNAQVIPVCISPNVVGKVACESTLLNPLLDHLRKTILKTIQT